MHTSNLTRSSFFPPFSFFSNKTSKSKHKSSNIIEIKPVSQSGKMIRPLGFSTTSFKCMQSCSDTSVSRSSNDGCCCSSSSSSLVPCSSVVEKVKCLASEFKSLPEPIDRVKRLLQYAKPPFDEAAKVEENRVMGCTAQVWLEVKMVDDHDGHGLMRFRVDSDSEITKGFCSCLIWLLDGVSPEEVLSVKIDDLFYMNVGLPSRGHSRVNTWHNVLISMQKRTNDFIEERKRKLSLEDLSSLLVWPDGCINVYGSFKEANV